jgi:hypothetical protein
MTSKEKERMRDGAVMSVEFRRTGERRYAVSIVRANHSPLEMNPAPGYDPIMPHDLLHFVVESELGLTRGVFGQIADGGTAGTFRPISITGRNDREAARDRRRGAARGEKLLEEGGEEAAWAEEATTICLSEWLSRSSVPERRKIAVQRVPEMKQGRASGGASGRKPLSHELLARICARLDELSEQWMKLAVGESFMVTWQGKR